jgi:hypothetical protein
LWNGVYRMLTVRSTPSMHLVSNAVWGWEMNEVCLTCPPKLSYLLTIIPVFLNEQQTWI